MIKIIVIEYNFNILIKFKPYLLFMIFLKQELFWIKKKKKILFWDMTNMAANVSVTGYPSLIILEAENPNNLQSEGCKFPSL